jgi:nucleoside-diphosphate-sugar epimerase
MFANKKSDLKMKTETKNINEKSVNGQLHVVLGVNGNTGRLVATELQKQGYLVRGISRSGNGPEGISVVKANALNLDELKSAVKGATVIYHCLGIPYSEWADKHPKIMRNIIEAASNGSSVSNGEIIKIVFADNLYAYGEQGAKLGKMSEETPELATDTKGMIRKELSSILIQADKEGKIKATIGRASDFFGPEASNSLFEYMVRPKITKNKPAEFFADLDSHHSFIYLPDFARSIVTLGTQEVVNGKVWILPHYEASSIKEFVTRFYEVSGVDIPKKIKKSPDFLLKLAGLFNKDIKEYSKMTYQMKHDWVVDDSKFRSSFKFKSTPLDQAFKETYDWFIIDN